MEIIQREKMIKFMPKFGKNFPQKKSQVPWLGSKVEQEMVLRVRSAQIQRFPY